MLGGRRFLAKGFSRGMMKRGSIDCSSAEHAESETNKIWWHEFLLSMARNRQYRVWRILALLHKPGQGLSAAGSVRVISEREAKQHWRLFCFWIQYLTNITFMAVRTT